MNQPISFLSLTGVTAYVSTRSTQTSRLIHARLSPTNRRRQPSHRTDLARSGGEIGWPRTTASLSAEEIIQLRFRVEFMENYLGMRVTEFKLAFRKALQDVGDLDAFKAVLELSKALIKLGVPAETEKILEATSELTIELIKKSNLTAAKAVAQLALEAYPDDAPQAWRLLNYTLDIPDLTSHEEYPSMAAAMLRQDWQASIWIAQTIHSEAGFPLNLTKLIMAMRNFGLMPNSNSPSIAEMIEWLITRANQLIPAQTDPQLRLRLQTYQNSLTKLNTTWPQLSPRQQLGDQFLKPENCSPTQPQAILAFLANNCHLSITCSRSHAISTVTGNRATLTLAKTPFTSSLP